MGNSAKVSLILTTYNCADQLPLVLDSIVGQDYANIEVVIKDGASTDGTCEIIRSYIGKGQLDIRYVSEKDSGIYDAMNKGLELSTGDIVAFFNDRFIGRGAVSKLVNAIGQAGNACIGAHGDLIYCAGKKIVRYWKMGNSGDIRKGWMPAHPTLFLRRDVYEKYGRYRTDLKCSADYEFMVRVLKDKSNQLAYVPEVLVSMFYGGTSSGGLGNYLLSLKEGHAALVSNGVVHAWLVDIRRTLRVLWQFREAKKMNCREP